MLPALAGCSIALNAAERCQTRQASSDASSGHSTSYALHVGAGPPVKLLSGCIFSVGPLAPCQCHAGVVSGQGLCKGPGLASRAMAAASGAITGLSASRAPSLCRLSARYDAAAARNVNLSFLLAYIQWKNRVRQLISYAQDTYMSRLWAPSGSSLFLKVPSTENSSICACYEAASVLG